MMLNNDNDDPYVAFYSHGEHLEVSRYKVECDMCGRFIGDSTYLENEEVKFDGYVVEFKYAKTGEHKGKYYLCKACTERLAKKASGCGIDNKKEEKR